MSASSFVRAVAASRRVDRASRIAARASAGILLFMMALIVLEVILREGFSTSTRFAHEYSGYLLVAIALWGTADVMAGGNHIRVSLVADRFSPGVRRQVERASYILGFMLSALLLISSARLVATSIHTGMLTMGVYQMPVFVPQLAIPIGFFFLTIQLFVGMLRLFVRAER